MIWRPEFCPKLSLAHIENSSSFAQNTAALRFGVGRAPIFKAATSQSCSRQELVIAVTSLAFEAHIARGPSVTVLCQHSSNLVASLRTAVSRGAAGLVSFGVAGGLAANLAPGDWVVASGVWTSENYFPADAVWAR